MCKVYIRADLNDGLFPAFQTWPNLCMLEVLIVSVSKDYPIIFLNEFHFTNQIGDDTRKHIGDNTRKHNESN